MCLVNNRQNVVTLDVPDFQQEEAAILVPRGVRLFVYYLPNVRYCVNAWLMTLDGVIPIAVYSTLMYSEWDSFCLPPIGLRIGVFMLILYFFEVNNAPMLLRRQFWCWILPKPIFDHNGMVHDDHPYIELFVEAGRLDPEALLQCGAFHDVKGGCDIYYSGTVWNAFNVWDCQGVWARRQRTRFVSTDLTLVDDEGVSLSWDGFVSPETVTRTDDGVPFGVDDDEGDMTEFFMFES